MCKKITYQKYAPEKDKSLESLTEEEKIKYNLRKQREQECFSVVNRGLLWYNKLSMEQHSELVNWYNAWLDVTETMIIPNKPTWLNDKLEEEIIL